MQRRQTGQKCHQGWLQGGQRSCHLQNLHSWGMVLHVASPLSSCHSHHRQRFLQMLLPYQQLFLESCC